MDKCKYNVNDEFCCDDCPMVGIPNCPEFINDNDSWSTDAAAKRVCTPIDFLSPSDRVRIENYHANKQ